MQKLVIVMSLSALLSGCVGIPANVRAVEDFDAQRYVGTWYEIARLENRFEKGLEKVAAEYGLRDDGGLTVVNRGYDPEKGRWKEATGRAYFVGPPTRGRLKVSFLGPFYGAYNVIGLDEDYGWSLVCGRDHAYLWILSRTPQLPDPVVNRLVEKAQARVQDRSAGVRETTVKRQPRPGDAIASSIDRVY